MRVVPYAAYLKHSYIYGQVDNDWPPTSLQACHLITAPASMNGSSGRDPPLAAQFLAGEVELTEEHTSSSYNPSVMNDACRMPWVPYPIHGELRHLPRRRLDLC